MSRAAHAKAEPGGRWYVVASGLLMATVRIGVGGPRHDALVAPVGAHVKTHVPPSAQPGRRWYIVALILLVIGVACLVEGLGQHRHALDGPVASPPAPRASPAASRATSVGVAPPPSKAAPLVAARSTPVELRIPAIALTVSLSTLGLNPDGTVEVPTVIQQPGWFRLGPSPGQMGSAVILGHVDSYQGPAVFFNLHSLVAGDLVDVTLADGVTAHFMVTSVAQYLKADFPDQAVYGSHGISALQLITCSGVFDTSTGHYLSNVVVSTSLVALTPAVVVPTIAPPLLTARSIAALSS